MRPSLDQVLTVLERAAREHGLRPQRIMLGAGRAAFFGCGGRHDLYLDAVRGIVSIRRRGKRDERERTFQHVVEEEADLAMLVPGIVDMLASWAPFVSFETLEEGATCEVLRPFEGVPAGALLRLRERKYVPYEGAYYAFFERLDGGPAVVLTEQCDAHLPVLRDMDLYLAPRG